MKQMSDDAKKILEWRKFPLKYIEENFNLVPQPLKTKKDNLDYTEYTEEDFQEFKKGKHLTWQQWLFFREIELGLKEQGFTGKLLDKAIQVFISVASGHGTGKSCNLSLLIFWALTCFLDCQIACTAPTADQMYDVLWKEAAKWNRKMKPKIAEIFDISSQYIRVKERPETWWARARTARKENPEALAGIHADVVIIIVDEASGVPEEIFEVAQGALTGKLVIFVMVSNPTRLSGYFYDSHHKNRDNWRRLKFNSEESPIVEKDYCERMSEQYGIDSPQYEVRVRGEFPSAEENQLISAKLFDDASNRLQSVNLEYSRCLGIDVAAFGGDRTALTSRQSLDINVLKIRKDQDTVATTGDAVAEIRKAKASGNPFNFVMVDVIGLGRGVYDNLIDLQKNGEIDKDIKIMAVNVAETAYASNEYHNKRAELYDKLREALETGYCDPRLREDCISVKYKFDKRGRMQLIPKDQQKKELGFSPDLSDSAAITFVVGNVRRDRMKKEYKPPTLPRYLSGRI